MGRVRALQAERLAHLDLGGFLRVLPAVTVAEVLARMRQERVTVVFVEAGDGRLHGIFTERDVLLKIVGEPDRLHDAVETWMTQAPQTVSTDATAGQAIHRMNEGHYRNVPVVGAGGHAVGNVCQHAIIRCLTDQYPRQIYNLPPDPELIARTREGA